MKDEQKRLVLLISDTYSLFNYYMEYEQMNLKHNNILIFKGFKWSKLLKLNRQHLIKMFIQVVTLSRYTHVGIVVTYEEKLYLVEALHRGIVVRDITKNINWIQTEIIKNSVDVFQFKQKMKLTYLQEFISNTIEEMYKFNIEENIIGSYNFKGLLNQFVWCFFNKSPFQKQSLHHHLFCSELCQLYFTGNIENAFLYSPYDIANSDFFYTKLF